MLESDFWQDKNKAQKIIKEKKFQEDSCGENGVGKVVVRWGNGGTIWEPIGSHLGPIGGL